MNSFAFFLNSSGSAIKDIDISGILGKLDMGTRVLVLGMLIVFAVLALLWLCLVLFRLVFHDLPERLRQRHSVPDTTDADLAKVEEEKLIAAITAAITAMNSEDGKAPPRFRVVSFRRIN